MYKISLIALLVFFCATFAVAQEEEYHKVEVSVGYSHLLANGVLGDGELYADDPDERLTSPDTENFNKFPSPIYSGSNDTFFASSPFVYSGRRHRPGLKGFSASGVYNFSKYVGVKFEVSGHYRSGETNDVGGFLPLTAPYDQPTGLILPLQASYPIGPTIRAMLVSNSGFSKTRQQHYNYLGGLQIKNNSKEKRFKPFAHALAGVSRQSVEFEDFTQRELALFGNNKFTNTGFTMAFGGGIDIRLSRRIDLRVIQIDYNPVKIKEQQIVEFKQPITNLGFQNSLSFKNLSTATLYSNNDIRINSRWQNNFRIGIGIVFH